MGGTNSVNYQNGVMPTDEWFEKIKAHVDFVSKVVIDFGAAEGIMSNLAVKAGAIWVKAVDNQVHFLPSPKVAFINMNIENFGYDKRVDVGIFSMIIHWVGKKELLRQAKNIDTLAIIFREKNPGYQIPINGKWFPTLKELTATLKGFKLKHSEVLMEQDNNKRIILAIYDKKSKKFGS